MDGIEKLTLRQLGVMEIIAAAAVNGAVVARILEDEPPTIAVATALTDQDGITLPPDADVREAFLRVAVRPDRHITYWPIRQLMSDFWEDRFTVDEVASDACRRP